MTQYRDSFREPIPKELGIAERKISEDSDSFRDALTPSSESRKARRLPFRSIEDLIAEEPEEPPWLWRGFLVPSAITLISGKPKIGKSSFVSALLPRLAGGEPFLGLPTRPTRTVLLTEENETTVVEKMRRFGRPPLDVLCWPWIADWRWSEIAVAAAQHARERKAELLIVDTFNAFCGLRGEEENAAGAVQEKMKPLRAATTRGLAVLLVAHERKSGGSYGDAVRGSGALVGAVDIAISLGRSSSVGPNVRSLDTVSRFVGTPSKLLVELDGDNYRTVTRQRRREEQAAEPILAIIARHGEADVATIAKESGIPDGTVRSRLKKLDVESSGKGRRGSPKLFRLKQTA